MLLYLLIFACVIVLGGVLLFVAVELLPERVEPQESEDDWVLDFRDLKALGLDKDKRLNYYSTERAPQRTH